jgi:hypothetical protein
MYKLQFRLPVLTALFFLSSVFSVVKAQQAAQNKYTYKIINSVDSTFGYAVYCNDKLKVYQPNIPGLPGNKGFSTRKDAEKIAQLVIGKIKKGEIPPGVTPDEMKKLKVIY